MTTPMTIVVALIFLSALFESFVEVLNLRHSRKEGLPQEFQGFFDEEKYRKSQKYLEVNTHFGLVSAAITVPITILFLVLGGFQWVDQFVRNFGFSSIIAGILFVFILGGLSWLMGLPLSLYRTFVIEEKFGFNKTTVGIYIGDLVKGTILSVIIGAPVLAILFWFFESVGDKAWFFAWAMLAFVQIFLHFLAPVLIMPLFNKFIPLPDGPLKEAIEAYAQKQNFKLKGIFTMDGSKRSTKANAFFTGFGRFRRVVLFDTLIAKSTVAELVAILAHEIGHFKRKHILKFLLLSLASTALMLYVFGIAINQDWLFQAFGVSEKSVYASLVFLAVLYAPISTVFGIFTSHLSRKFEFEADAYAAKTTGSKEDLIVALKKLSVENLSNLNPHPLKVFLEYSHPPVLQRVRVLAERAD